MHRHTVGRDLLNPNRDKALSDLKDTKVQIKCKYCENMLNFDTAAIFTDGQTLVCSKCGNENYGRADSSALLNYISLMYPDKDKLN